MAKNKENFKELGQSELVKKLASLREELRSIKWKAEGAKPKNVKESSMVRKNTARILTVMNSK